MMLSFRLGLPTFIGKKCKNISYDLSVFGFSWMLLVTKIFNRPGNSGRWAQVRQLGHSLRSARAEASATNITVCRFPTHTALRLLARFEEMHLRCKPQLNWQRQLGKQMNEGPPLCLADQSRLCQIPIKLYRDTWTHTGLLLLSL